MSEELANSIALWIIIPATCGIFVILIITAAGAAGPPRGLVRRRRERQLAELDKVRSEASGQTLKIDWIRFKHLPDSEIRDVLGKYGWRYQGEAITSKSWLLRFGMQPATTAGPDANERLRSELADATPGVDGSYLLDTSHYSSLGLEQVKSTVNSAGWLVAGLEGGSSYPTMRLTRRGATTVPREDRTFLQGASPAELREDPQVAARAKEIQREQGFDPLSGRELNNARERHRYWQKRFNRQVALASLYTIVGGLLLGAFFGSDQLGWDSDAAYLVAIPLILLLLAGVSTYKAIYLRRARRAEIGRILDAYAELNRLARRHHAP